ncbi:hypothetical protein GCM10022254_51830 [Actinomadura meridiana]|uniref:Uncharacterized protein n=1 Tax=Actinomadura meridiana TaxID=559626 RepID=A0ABP8CDH9_9ACTN
MSPSIQPSGQAEQVGGGLANYAVVNLAGRGDAFDDPPSRRRDRPSGRALVTSAALDLLGKAFTATMGENKTGGQLLSAPDLVLPGTVQPAAADSGIDRRESVR